MCKGCIKDYDAIYKRRTHARIYYHKNKERINENKKEKVLCNVCNCMIRKADISKHNKRKKHINNLKSNNIL